MSQTYDGATTALHRRFEALEAKLLEACGLATEQGMRMQRTWAWSRRWKALAKKLRQTVRNWEDTHYQEVGERSDGAMVLTLQLKEARQRIGELTAELADFKRHAQGVSDAQEEALATERAAREQDNAAFEELRRKWNESERERDTALARATAANLGAAIDAERAVKAEARCKAAETALASARERLSVLEPAWNTLSEDARTAALEAAGNLVLTSHPAPVAAPYPCKGCVNCADTNCPNYPGKVVAPCAGCAAAHAELERRTVWSNEQLAKLSAQVERLDLGQQLRRIRRLIEQKQRLLAERRKLSNRLHVKRAEAAHWRSLYSNRIKRCLQCRDLEARLEEVQHCCDKAVENRATIERMEADYDACHRQHEQCMKLLEQVKTHLAYHGTPESAAIARVIGEMLSKGELPETPCTRCEETKKLVAEWYKESGGYDNGNWVAAKLRARFAEKEHE